MKISLISPSPHPNKISAYGVRIISSCLKKIGCDAQIIFLPRQVGEIYSEDVHSSIVELTRDADLIGISLMTDDLENAILITQTLKSQMTTPIIWGGIHPTIQPRECLSYADMVAIGEGEDSLLELVEKKRSGEDFSKVLGIWFKQAGQIIENSLRPLIRDLDRLPFPDYEYQDHWILFEGKVQPLNEDILRVCLREYYLTMTTRGCPYRCSYCWNHAYNRLFQGNPLIRKRSITNVIEELKSVNDRFPFVEMICIDDDAFFLRSDEEIEEFGRQYQKHIPIPMWVTGATPATLSERKLAALTQAGMTSLRMGVQSGSPHTKQLYKGSHSNQAVLKAVQLIHQFREIKKPQYDLILDNPWETSRDLCQTLMFLSQFPVPYQLFFFPLQFYPGTDLYEKARTEGKIPSDELEIVRARHHGFKQIYLNELFFLLDNLAQRGMRIQPWKMFLLVNPVLIKLGLSRVLHSYLRQKFDKLPSLAPAKGESRIDFAKGDYSHQLGTGWHPLEKGGGGPFRWTKSRAEFFLFPLGEETTLEIQGMVPDLSVFDEPSLVLQVFQDDNKILHGEWTNSEPLQLKIPLCRERIKPSSATFFQLRLNTTFSPARKGSGSDIRELGLIITSLGLV
jgi:anaerobic magnesium-protoporphyrin IX monomethyl ester cyclase